MRYYLEHYPPPGLSFSPDGSFPVVMGEKGIFHYRLRAAWPQQQEEAPLHLISLTSGTALNIVPAAAKAEFAAAAEFQLSLKQGLPPGITLSSDSAGTLTVRAVGRACHASAPELGENAMTRLLAFLATLDFAPAGAKNFIGQLAQLLHDSRYGSGLGIADEDAYSRLTNVPSLLRIDATGGELGCDLRIPVSRQSTDYIPRLTEKAAQHGLELEQQFCQEPLFLGAEHPLVQTLIAVYRNFTGQPQAEPLVQGGGTYAKTMPNCLAFGPEQPDEPLQAHQVDESLAVEQLLHLAKLYARAIYYLAK
jgi:succinyl-diaminopimelate desuccinylase